MKKFITASIFFTTTLVMAADGLTPITLLEDKDLGQDLKQAFSKGIIINTGTGGAPSKLATSTLVFQTPESKSDFKIEIDGDEVVQARMITLKGMVKETTPHEIDKLAVLKEELTTNSLTAVRMKNGTVKFFADRSYSVADYHEIECTGCVGIWAGVSLNTALTTPREAGSGLATGRASGTGLATGRAKVIMDRDTGRSKSRTVSKNDEELINGWLELFKEQPKKEIVMEFEKLSSGMIEDLLEAKTIKLIVPIAMEKGTRSVIMGFGINEQGVKLAIQNGNVTVTLQVNEAKPMEPREK